MEGWNWIGVGLTVGCRLRNGLSRRRTIWMRGHQVDSRRERNPRIPRFCLYNIGSERQRKRRL
jgi:hypothetical protein